MSLVFKAFKLGTATTFAATTMVFAAAEAMAEGPAGSATDQVKKFRQLGTELPSPNVYRSASGAPGPAYWQQQADYVINAALDEDKQHITANLTIDYTNNSPDELNYIWLALDQNRFKDGSMARESAIASAAGSRRGDGSAGADRYSFGALRYAQAMEDREYGFEFQSVTDGDGDDYGYVINDTMMRIDFPEGIAPGDTVQVNMDWEHNIIDEVAVGGRGGYEYFEEEDNYIFGMAQWFPRLAAYTDYTGWQNKQFLGRGEFTLEFGDYEVNLTVPADHIVSATGVLQNPKDVLTAEQRKRLDDANTEAPIYIVTPEEAEENEKSKSKSTKTWTFKAENVRDFAWSSSRKYIWDAMIHEQTGGEFDEVLAMSFFPKEADPIWSQYSTHAVAHTMDVYNRFAFPYPYPTAQSVNTWERGGMEYPMITFNGYRPSEDEKTGDVTYSRNIKYGLIGVIIHEIGHIYFPMVVNSDERRWTWMDEGLNSFLEYLAEYEWEENFPISGGQQNPLDVIPRYMSSSNQVPIMTQSDSVLQFGPNAYSKPAASLIVLRETVMGRELFDFAFKEYATRWMFKRPTPGDFFRTMEDASAVDLDWFWRGWYFGTDHVDMSLEDVREYTLSTQDPEAEVDRKRADDAEAKPENITQRRNREEGRKLRINEYDDLEDFYNENDKFEVTNKDRNKFKSFLDGLKDWERKAYDRAMEDETYLYFVDFKNVGGLISPLPLTITYEDGDTKEMMVPAEIWRRDANFVTKLITSDKPIDTIVLDAAHQTADADHSNNAYPRKRKASRLELYKSDYKAKSLMADMLVELKTDDEDGEGEKSNKGEATDGIKSVPLSDGNSDDTSSDAGDASSDEEENHSHSESKSQSTDKISKDAKSDGSNSKDKAEDKDSRLKRTLDRLMGRDDK